MTKNKIDNEKEIPVNKDNKEKKDNIFNKIEDKIDDKTKEKKIYRIIKTLVRRIKKSNFSYTSSFLAYSILLSLIPMLIFLSQILASVNPEFEDSLFKAINYLPESSKYILKNLLTGMISIRSSSLSLLALISWIWLGSRGFSGLINALNEIFGINKNRSFIFDKAFGLVYLIGFCLILVALLVFNVFNERIIGFLEQYTRIEEVFPRLYDFLLQGFLSLIPLIMMGIMFLFFYKFAPAVDKDHKIPFGPALIGSLFTSIAIALITTIYSYTQNLSKMNLYYGSMAGILAILVWLLMICQAIVIGAELIASIMEVNKKIELSDEKI